MLVFHTDNTKNKKSRNMTYEEPDIIADVIDKSKALAKAFIEDLA